MGDDRSAMLRQSLARADQRASGKGFPPELRQEVATFVRGERAKGRSYAALGAALGISSVSVAKWERAYSDLPFAAVEIVASAVATSSLVVHGPSGLRIEGATVEDIARLWARLR